MHLARPDRVLGLMRSLLASALFALGCSFALVALRGGEHVIAAVTLVTACSTGAAIIRLLGTARFVDDLDNPEDAAGHR